jgi:UDP-glucuronate decarboxylase
MKILVLGGSGFIGSNLCRKLIEQGNTVYCLDDFSTSSKNNLSCIIKNENFHLINHDIRKEINILDVNQIYNLASPAAPEHYRRDPLKTLETNIYGTKNALELATKLDIPMMHSSTVRVFEYDHTGLNSCYTEGKRVAETLCNEYRKKYSTKVKIARLKSIYGQNMSINDSRVIPQFIMKSLKNEDLFLFGNGEQKDSFCYIDDFIEVFIKFMNTETLENTLNIGNQSLTTIKELVNVVLKITNSNSKIIFKENGKNFEFDIDFKKSYDILSWYPKTSLEEGIHKTADYYKNLI